MDNIIRCNIKRIIAIFLFCGMVSNVVAGKMVLVYAKTGEILSFLLEKSTKVTFRTDNIVVDLDGKQVSFPLSDYVTFKIVESSEVGSIAVSNKKLICRIEGKVLFLKNLIPNSSVGFYSLSGILLDSSRADAEGTLIYDLGLLSNQIVVVKTVHHSFKICL